MADIHMPAIPPEVLSRFAEFTAARRTGRLILNVKDGRVVVWELTETGHVDRRDR